MKKKMVKSSAPSSRRSVLKSSAIGVTTLAALGGFVGAGIAVAEHGSLFTASHADGGAQAAPSESIKTILNTAATAEALAVTFYTHVLANANALKFSAAGLADIKAALVEEFLHLVFLESQGARPLTTTFSFPFGNDTFKNFNHFINVQQQLESLFVAAYLIAGKEFALWNRPDLVLVAAQIGGVEAEHRAIGRAIGGLRPANNRVFESALLTTVGQAATILKKDGFLNPTRNNTFQFQKPSFATLTGISTYKPTDMDWSNSSLS